MPPTMNDAVAVGATHAMVAECFKALIYHVGSSSGQSLSEKRRDCAISVDRIVDGLFVTWETLDGDLRGCIGSLSQLPLTKLQEYAITSSQRDRRFSPISLAEISQLQCTVSVLHTMELCKHVDDWEVGVHGIVVEFLENGSIYRATFLPHVMVEQRWTREQALTQACAKSGYKGSVKSVLGKMSITRYQSSIATLSHAEYVEKFSK